LEAKARPDQFSVKRKIFFAAAITTMSRSTSCFSLSAADQQRHGLFLELIIAGRIRGHGGFSLSGSPPLVHPFGEAQTEDNKTLFHQTIRGPFS
jgi:hypothetical protein